ncbi:MAG: molecular chaperone DnaJ [Candidatus Aminicenantes bacterium RBG_13_59_9]|jgi:molecular chaperone DnaJ|nr:MAG: molecular chaperone DnaJ [Candidatus Aminicenantes bacterium RBG_13_59_9]
MTKRDYYEVLGVARTASADAVKRAYRQMALKHHPDRNPGDAGAEEKFKEAAEAYSVLGDPEKRPVYDRYGFDGLRGEGFSGFSGFDSSIFGDFEDILGSLFGFGDVFGTRSRRRNSPQRGRDLALEIEISLEEAASGVDKEISLSRAEHCPECRGTGLAPGTNKSECPTCRGLGQVRYQQGFFAVSRTCSHCHGAGQVIPSPCRNCHGAGRINQKQKVTVHIPAGVADGSRLRIGGQGEAGEAGAGRGDLYILVRVAKHRFFEREDSHLFCQIPLSFSQAALGVSVEIPGLDQESEILKIPAGTQTGAVFRMKGRGLKDLHGHRRGDIYVKVEVKTPENQGKEEKELLRRLAEIRGEELDGVDRSVAEKLRNRPH